MLVSSMLVFLFLHIHLFLGSPVLCDDGRKEITHGICAATHRDPTASAVRRESARTAPQFAQELVLAAARERERV